jgi:hypothetical protein
MDPSQHLPTIHGHMTYQQMVKRYGKAMPYPLEAS